MTNQPTHPNEDDALKRWLTLLAIPRISPRQVLAWLAQFPSTEAFFAAGEDAWHACGISYSHRRLLRCPDTRVIDAALDWRAQQAAHHIIPFDHPAYPPLLKQIAAPPLLLFVQGEVTVLSAKQMAMVGTRQATFTGLKHAALFAEALAAAGWVVTSGLARGIDSASHQGALDAGGATIAVFGTGLSCIYPKSNRTLADAIVAGGGALVSEFPLTTAAYSSNFPRRNRIIAGLSKGVLVVEAALKSGSLITARMALEEGREIFAIPGTIHLPLSQGCHYLIKQGAKLVDSIKDILEELGEGQMPASPIVSARQSAAPQKKCAISPQESKILQQIDYEITPMDVILCRSQLTVGEVSAMLLTLEMQGLVQAVVGGYVRVAV